MKHSKIVTNYLEEGAAHDVVHSMISGQRLESISATILALAKMVVSRKNMPLMREEIPGDETQGTTIVFSGWSMKLKTMYALLRSFPGPVIGYQLPYGMLSADPEVAAKAYAEIDELVQKDLQNPNVKRIVGFSLGTAIAFNAANQLAHDKPEQLEELVAIQVGQRIDTAVTRAKVARSITKDGIKRHLEAGEATSLWAALRKFKAGIRGGVGQKYDPIMCLDSLAEAQTPVRIYAGMNDQIISPAWKQFDKLERAMREKGVNVTIDKQEDRGHQMILPYAIRKIREQIAAETGTIEAEPE